MKEEKKMDEFMDQIDDSMKAINKGDVLEGKVLAINDDEVIVNLEHFSDGVITKEEFIDQQDVSDEEKIQVGDVIPVYVINPNDNEGNVVLSHKKAVEAVLWDELEKAFTDKSNIKVKVKEVVKGGVIAYYKNVRCFIPASLLSYRYVENLEEFTGKELEVRVEDFDFSKKRVVLSRKVVETEERDKQKAEILSKIEVGQKYDGVVTKIMNYGAFVDIGGVEGLAHISDLAWYRVKHPSEVVSEGQKVEVSVVNFDPKKNKIGLAVKDVDKDPWNSIKEDYHTGDVIEGKVVKLTDFGAFVEIGKGLEGLVHVSEISTEHVHKPEDVLKAGDKVEVKILKIDDKNRKLSLSIKEAEGQTGEAEESEFTKDEQGTTLGDLFGDKLKDFFK